jgi:hypothetical protein
MTYFVTMSHIMQNGSRRHKAASVDEAKAIGDTEFSSVKPYRGADYRIVVTDEAGNIAASRLVGEGHAWKDEPARGCYQEFPKMLNHGGREIIVNSREEEEAALAPPAEAPVKKARAR